MTDSKEPTNVNSKEVGTKNQTIFSYIEKYWPFAGLVITLLSALLVPIKIDSPVIAPASVVLFFLIFIFIAIFQRKNLKVWGKIGLVGLAVIVSALLLFWIYKLSQPQFSVTALNTIETGSQTYEVSDLLIFNKDRNEKEGIRTKFEIEVIPWYPGALHYGLINARISGPGGLVEKETWKDFTNSSSAVIVPITLKELVDISQIQTISSSDLATIQNPVLSDRWLNIDFVQKSTGRTFQGTKIRIRNAPWQQHSALFWKTDHFELQVNVKNLGETGKFKFYYRLARLNEGLNSKEPNPINNNTTYVISATIPDQYDEVTLNQEKTYVQQLDAPKEPGRYMLEVYAFKQEPYVEFVDPEKSWDALYRTWFFMRNTDQHAFLVTPSQTLSIDPALQQEYDRSAGEQIDLGRPMSAAEAVVSNEKDANNTPKFSGMKQVFERGEIYQYQDKDGKQQVFTVYGKIFEYAKSLPSDEIGLPVSTVETVTSSTGVKAERMVFEGYWNENDKGDIIHYPLVIYASSIGVADISGWIGTTYMGVYQGPSGILGLPLSKDKSTAQGWIQEFENGYIVYYVAQTGDGNMDYTHRPIAFPYLTKNGKTMYVYPEGWQDTGIYVNAGQMVEVNYIDQAWRDKDGAQWYDGNGNPEGIIQAGSLVEKSPIGALVGRIGDGGYTFFVGRAGSIKAPSSGELYLAMNGTSYESSEGALVIEVVVQ